MGDVPPTDPAPDPAPLPEALRWRRVMRGPLPRVLFIAAVLFLAARIYWSRPVAVEVIYDYGPARAGLLAAQMEYLDGGEALRRVRFDYAQTAAGRTQLHAAQLPRGDYAVLIRLTYQRQIPSALRLHRVETENGRPTITLQRPLHVGGTGQSTILIAE